MDKKILKVIKSIVEVEIAKEREYLLTNIFPKLLQEQLTENTPTTKTRRYDDGSNKIISKNKILDEILKSTKPFTPEERSGKSSSSVLDVFENSQVQNSYIPSYESAEPDIDMGTISNPIGIGTSYVGSVQNNTQPNSGGLGVKTGLAGLDRILNRDNSELVKKFKK